MIMKLSIYSMHDPEQFNGFQQIIAHLAGMAQAFLKHYPITGKTKPYASAVKALSPAT
jgi:hypothetical protein